MQADLGHGFINTGAETTSAHGKLLQKLVLAASNGQTTLASTIDMSALTSVDAGFLSQGTSVDSKASLVVGSNYKDNIVANVSFQIDDPYGLVRKGATVNGGAGNDTIIGAQLMDGGDGDDLLVSANTWLTDSLLPRPNGTFKVLGSTILGGQGNDTITGGMDITSGAGNDVITATQEFTSSITDDYSMFGATIRADEGDDTITGGTKIDAGDGDDVVQTQMRSTFNHGSQSGTNFSSSGAYIDAGAGNDRIEGGTTVLGGDGNDLIITSSAWSTYSYMFAPSIDSENSGGAFISAGTGDDTVFGGSTIDGGDGNDRIESSMVNRAYNRTGPYISETKNAPQMIGALGNDTLLGGQFIRGGEGDDTISGQTLHSMTTGDDTILGGSGNDSILVLGATTKPKSIFVNSDIGDDLVTVRDDLIGQFTLNIILSDGNDSLYGNSASATINMVVDGGLGRDFIATGSGNDSVTDSGNTGGYAITLDGNDQLNLTGNEFVVTTGNGDDSILGTLSNSFLFTEDGNDVINMIGTQNNIFAGRGFDAAIITGDKNTIKGEDDADTILVIGNGNTAFGNNGTDVLVLRGFSNSGSGGEQDDILVSESGFNVIDGGDGNDLLTAINTPESLLIGGSGRDHFVAADVLSQSVLILDFVMSEDTKAGF